MRRVFIFFLILLLLSSGCTMRVPNIETKDVVRTYAGTQAGTMSWDVEGAVAKPSPVWTYYGKDVFSQWYYRIGNLNVSGDVVYTGGDRLTAIDLKTGKELWETQLKNSSPKENAVTYILYPTICEDKIVAVGARLVVEKDSDYYFERRNVLVFDRVTGELLWKSTDIGSKNQYFTIGFPIILDDKIYVPALNGEYRASEYGYGSKLACKEEERGIWEWELNTGKLLDKIFFSFPEGELSPTFTKFITDGKNLYVIADVVPSVEKTNRDLCPAYLIAFDPLHRKVLWQNQITDSMGVNMEFNSSGVNNKVIIVYRNVDPTNTHGPDSWIRAFDKKTGRLLWSKDKEASLGINIALTEDRLFVPVADNSLSCFDPLTGKEIWTYKCSHKSPSANFFTIGPIFTPFLPSNVLYLQSFDMIIALNPDSGQELWSIIPPFPKMIDEKEDSNGYWMLIPVDNGFVTLYADFAMSGDAMLSPSVVQLWSIANNKK